MGSSPAAQRCVVALLTMIQVYAPHASNEMWSAVQNVLPEHKGKLCIVVCYKSKFRYFLSRYVVASV